MLKQGTVGMRNMTGSPAKNQLIMSKYSKKFSSTLEKHINIIKL